MFGGWHRLRNNSMGWRQGNRINRADIAVSVSTNQYYIERGRASVTGLGKPGTKDIRLDTFGDQAFWGSQLKLHQAINKLPPQNALALGPKVDAEALPASVVEAVSSAGSPQSGHWVSIPRLVVGQIRLCDYTRMQDFARVPNDCRGSSVP